MRAAYQTPAPGDELSGAAGPKELIRRCRVMCNNYERHLNWSNLQEALAVAGLNVALRPPALLPPTRDVRVSDDSAVLRAAGNGVEAVTMRWGFRPARTKAAPVFNFRADGRDFSDSRRCLIPASAFFEFTGDKAPKSKWRFTMRDEPMFCVAGLWKDEEHGRTCSFTMLTLPPGPDVAPFHDRQIVTLAPKEWARWLCLEGSGSLDVPPAGTLAVSLVRQGRDEPSGELLALAHPARSAA